MLFSTLGYSQGRIAPPATSNLSKQKLIDELIEVAHYKESVLNYSKFYLELKMFDYNVEPPKQLLTEEEAKSIIRNFNFGGLKTSFYSVFSFISEENLKELIIFYKNIGGKLSNNNSIFLMSPTLDLNIKNQLDYAIENLKKQQK